MTTASSALQRAKQFWTQSWDGGKSKSVPRSDDNKANTAAWAGAVTTTVEEPPLPQPSSDVYELVRVMNWHKAVRECKKNPIDASYQDGDDFETPLYLACQNRPPVRVIRALLEAFPQAVETKSRHGDLPIHVACRFNASNDVLKELVKDYPHTAACQTKFGQTSIVMLWESRDATNLTVHNRRVATDHCYRSVFWQKMQILLEAVAKSRDTSVLHAAISLGSLGCPHQVLEYVLYMFPDLVRQVDQDGRLPIHMAVGPSSWTAPEDSSYRRKYKPREQMTIEKLLKLYPEAALIPDPVSKRYPLHTALANRHSWEGGVKELFEAAPNLMVVIDPVTGVYPFQLAAIPAGDTLVDLGTIFSVLRAHPAVLESCGRRSLQEESSSLGLASTSAASCEHNCCFCNIMTAAGSFASSLYGGGGVSKE